MIGKRIKSRRNDLGITQEELAKKAGYASKASISRIENGTRDLDQEQILLFSKLLQTTPMYLLGIEPESTTNDTAYLPYLGTVSAGSFAQTDNNRSNKTFSIPKNILKEDDSHYFVLSASGDSMNRVIANGHYVVVLDFRTANNTSYKNGDILIIQSNGEFTMKRVIKTDTTVILEPDSYLDGFTSAVYKKGENMEELIVIGKVIYSFSRF